MLYTMHTQLKGWEKSVQQNMCRLAACPPASDKQLTAGDSSQRGRSSSSSRGGS